jgi:hypothetical protein
VIPSDQATFDKMKALSERNIANGDWGDEVTVYGFPGEDVPMSPEEREAKRAVSQTLVKQGDTKLSKK